MQASARRHRGSGAGNPSLALGAADQSVRRILSDGASTESGVTSPTVTLALLREVQTEARLGATAEERDLVGRMRAGDELAFEEFADHYIPGIHRFAANRLRGEPELTRDIVQSTVCKVIEKLDTFRGEAPLMVWLYACCRNEIAGHFRKMKTQPSFAVADEEMRNSAEAAMVAPEGSPEVLLLQGEQENLVHVTLDHLPPRYSAALKWKYLQGESVDEISRRLEVSPKAAESLLTRARRAFEEIHSRLVEKHP